MTTETQWAQAFEQERHRLLALAYRVLASWSDAEDAVQEAWLRLSRQDIDAIDNLQGWLTTVISRICIDTLRSRAARPEASIDQDFPDLVVTDDRDTPEETAVLSDSVGLALLVVLGSLRPDERLAFVLHDMFAVPFAEIGPIVGRSVRSRQDAGQPGTPQSPGRTDAGGGSACAARGRRCLSGRRAGWGFRRSATGAGPRGLLASAHGARGDRDDRIQRGA